MDNKRELRQILRAIKRKEWESKPTKTWLYRAFDWFSNPPAVGFLNVLTVVGLGIGLLAYLSDLSSQKEARVFNAWQLLAMKQNGGFGRREALEYLNTQDCLFGSAGTISNALYASGMWGEFFPRCALGFESRDLLVDSSGQQISFVGLKLSDSPENGGVQLPYTRLVQGRISNSDLSYTNLGDSNLNGTYLFDVKFDYSNFAYADLSQMYNQLSSFDCSLMQGVKIREAQFANVKMRGVRIWEAEISGSYFGNVSFEDAGLSYLSMQDSALSDVSFERSLLNNTTMSARLQGDVSFRNAHMKGAVLSAVFEDFDDESAKLPELDFTGANISGANISIHGKGTTKFEGAWYCDGEEPTLTLPDGAAPVGLSPRQCTSDSYPAQISNSVCTAGGKVSPHRDL